MHKRAFIISGVVLVAVVGIMFAQGRSMLSVPSTSVMSGAPVSFTELAHGTHSDVERRANFLITSTDELSVLWKMVDTSVARPNIDFTKDMVIAVFAGTEPTLGYSVGVTKVSDADKRVVAVVLTKPGGSCVVGESLTQPYQIIVLPKTELPFGHEDHLATVSCLQ